jgi:hypothetical protein
MEKSGRATMLVTKRWERRLVLAGLHNGAFRMAARSEIQRFDFK